MDTTRRTILAGGAVGALVLTLAGCGEEGPVTLTITATGQSGMNPGSDGADRAVTVNVVQMTGTSAFNSADAIALQDPQSALGAELLRADRLVVPPGGSASSTVVVNPGATTIGITAGFLSPGGKTVRTTLPAPGSPGALAITVGPGGLSVASA